MAVFKRKLWWFNLKRYGVENVCHPLPAHLFFFHCWTLKQCFGKGVCHYVVWMELLYVCCHMWMLCVVSAELTGWEGGRGEQQAWTPPPPPRKTYFGWEDVHLNSLCKTTHRGHALHVYMYVCWMYYKAKGDTKLFIFGLLELLQCQNFVNNGMNIPV